MEARKAVIAEKLEANAQIDAVKEIEKLDNGETYKLRITMNGDTVNGHWVDGTQSVATGEGFKFTVTKDSGLLYLANDDFGHYEKIVSESGDIVFENRVGHKFPKPMAGAKDVIKAAVNWLAVVTAETATYAKQR